MRIINRCFLTQNITYIIVLTTESNILEDDDSSQSHDWLLFSVDEFHYLNAARVGSSTACEDFDCTFKCFRSPFCLSINMAASKAANGNLWRETVVFFDHNWRRQQHKREPSKNCWSNYEPKITSCWRAESKENVAWRKICENLNSRMESNKIIN